MKVSVHTESGSIYVLDKVAMTWKKTRELERDPINSMRTTDGILTEWPSIEIGKPLILKCPVFTEGTDFRAILGTPVVRIEPWQ